MNKIFRYIGYVLFRPIWWLEKIVLRDEKLWIFGAWYGQQYSDNSKYLYEYVMEHNSDIKIVWITKNKKIVEQLRSQHKNACLSNSVKGVFYCLRAKYAFLTSGVVDVNKFFLNGIRQIWLWHGMPLKKILKCEDSYLNISDKKRKIQQLLNPYDYFNPYATLSSSDFFNGFLSDSFGLTEDYVWKLGLPRCDAFFNDKKEDFVAELKSKYNSPRVMFYMPTFRMTNQLNGERFVPFIERFGYKADEFSSFLEEKNIVMLYKPHFADLGVKLNIDTDRFVLVDDTMYKDLYCLLNSVDILLTDYSSVYFDFLPTKKPIFLLPFDYDEYLKKSRGHFFNMYEEMEGIVCKDWGEVYKNYNNQIYNADSNIKKFCKYIDGHSCEKLVNKVLGL